MRSLCIMLLLSLGLTACQSQRIKDNVVRDQAEKDIAVATQARTAPASPEAVNQALLPQLNIEMPKASGVVETRFDLTVNNAPANQVFMAIVSGTRYSMLVHPDIKEALSVNLKDVTVTEALEAIRELYGYEFKFQGNRIYVQPVTVQMRLFRVNYLAGRRIGRADVRVTSGSIQSGAGAAPTGTATAATSATPTSAGGGGRCHLSKAAG